MSAQRPTNYAPTLVERERPDMFDSQADPEVWSNTSIGGRRLTWRELCAEYSRQLRHAQEFVALVSDLDRCVHGRHEQDVCSVCRREGHERNAGNPHLLPGTRLGTGLSGRGIVYPGPGAERDAEDWYA